MGSLQSQGVLLAVALAMAGGASADEAASSGYYVGGSVGLGFAQSSGGGDTISSFLLQGSPAPSSSTPAGNGAPSVSLLFGKSWPISSQFSAGLEFEDSYDGARGNANATGSFFATPFLGSITDSVQASSQWWVPAQAALRARAAFQVTPTVSLYASVGPALGYAHLRTTVSEVGDSSGLTRGTFQPYNNPFADSASAGKWLLDPGISFGAGVEVAVAPNIGLRGEYSLAAFRSISETASAVDSAATAKATPVFQGVRVGLVRHF